jgi:ribonuclease PH
VEQATLERRRSSSASDGAASVAVALLGEPASLELRSTSASVGVASVAVVLLKEQASLELRSTFPSDGAASVAVVLLKEQATLELRSTSASERSTSASEGVTSVAVALLGEHGGWVVTRRKATAVMCSLGSTWKLALGTRSSWVWLLEPSVQSAAKSLAA